MFRKDANEWIERYYKKPSYGPPDGTVETLTDHEQRDHVEMLVDKLASDDVKKRYKAAEALAAYVADQKFLPDEMEPHPAAVLASAFLKDNIDRLFCVSASRSLAMMGPHAAPFAAAALANVLKHPSTELRYEAIVALKRLGPGAASKAAATLAYVALEDEENLLRREAVLALAGMGPAAAEFAGKAVAGAVHDNDTDVQVAAIKALAELGPETARYAGPALQEALTTGSQELRRLAADTICKLGPCVAEWTTTILGNHLKPHPGTDTVLRKKAAKALLALGPDAVYETEVLLARAMKDRDPEARAAAFNTLQEAERQEALKGEMALEERIFTNAVLTGEKLKTFWPSDDEDSEDLDEESSEELFDTNYYHEESAGDESAHSHNSD